MTHKELMFPVIERSDWVSSTTIARLTSQSHVKSILHNFVPLEDSRPVSRPCPLFTLIMILCLKSLAAQTPKCENGTILPCSFSTPSQIELISLTTFVYTACLHAHRCNLSVNATGQLRLPPRISRQRSRLAVRTQSAPRL